MEARPVPASPAIPHPAAGRRAGLAGVPFWPLGALVGYGIFLFIPAAVLADGDTFSHVATGEWMLRHGAVPTADPFSFTFAGQPWVAHEWLSELLMGLAFRVGGWNGVLVLCGGAYALALANLGRHLSRWLPPVPALAAFILAALCTRTSMLARPHILALPVLELWATGLVIARERRAVPWRSLPLMLLWANLHGGFMFGLALACPFAAEAVWEAGPPLRRRVAGQWALFLVAATGLACATPQGWHGLLFPIQLLRMKEIGNVGEWMQPNFQLLQPVEAALAAMLYVCLTRGVRVPVARVAVLLGLLHLALGHDRHQLLAGVVGSLVIAGPIAAATGRAERPVAPLDRRIAFALAAVILAFTAGRAASPVALRNNPTAPIAAIDQVPPGLAAQPVLSDYAFGGYLIFKGIRPFIDARADMYGDAFLSAYRDLLQPGSGTLLRTLDERHIQWVILAPGSPPLATLQATPGWRRIFADDVAVVLARDP